MYILGISAFYHDSAAAIIKDGEILAAAQEERFTRVKHDSSFPSNAIRFCLDFVGTEIESIDAISFYDKPFLKFERLIETYTNNVPKGLDSFLKAIPVWGKEKLFLKKIIKDELKKLTGNKIDSKKLLFPEHHLSHAASCFYCSPFNDSAILIADGVGEWATTTLAIGYGNSIKVLKEIHFPNSIGLLYSAVTYYCGFKVNSGEYKLMGLAPYGNNPKEVERIEQIIRSHFCTVFEDGSISLNQDYFNYATGLRMVNEPKWAKLLGFPRRREETEITGHYCHLAKAIQQLVNDVMCKLARHVKEITGAENLCMAGGVALNCVSNAAIWNTQLFKNIYIQPAAGDAGGAIGSALAAHCIFFNNKRSFPKPNIYLGPAYQTDEVEKFARNQQAVYSYIEDEQSLVEKAADYLSEGKVVGWFQGRMEFGPRALGARSILADPRISGMQKKMNLKIKCRESFRPFAPSVLAEKANEYFDIDRPSPYMLYVFPVRNRIDHADPVDETIQNRINQVRSELPAITHVDFSARVQTVSKENNPRFHRLLETFDKITGCPVLINTSFNRRGEPIVCSIADAYTCFLETEMDVLIIENCIFIKQSQSGLPPSGKQQANFILD
ncbi:MAG: carbamoyltransferase [Bacteroidetes bacterium]|nr:carbamoyltransferase [Bacteroidota bacterium]